ncbi:HD domain-containing phosphohydrolase [Candidatus Izemoplasma sp. B36]|uniref:sensor domain-containing diguanylate cyclase/phosphohydrolase n=1 Tax=Candidatus Izemoplasma sp. B36 TaxID=3242468 RepID=UPI0035576A36
MFISMEAALYISSFCSFMGLILMFVYFKKHNKNENCAPCFMLYYLLQILWGLMMVFRSELGTFLSVIVANSLTVIGVLLIYKGICKYARTKFNLRLSVIIFIAFVVIFSIFTYAYNSILIRILIINIFHIFITGLSLSKLQSSKLKFSITDEFMSVLLMFYILILFSRIIFNLIYIDQNTSFLNFTLDPIFIFLLSIANLMFLTGILSLYNNDYVSKYIESERKNSSLISNLPGFAYRCLNDEYWTMHYVSNQFKNISGYKVKDIINNDTLSYEDLILDKYKKVIRDKWEVSIKNKEPFTFEYEIRQKDGSNVWVWEQGIPLYEDDNSCKYLEGFIMDITDRKQLENHLHILSYNDTLTKLHNRRYMESKLKEIEHNENYPISIIMGDINGLKFINDSFGHDYGDKVLIFVADTISSIVKDNDLISRISGDEYVIVLENTNEKKANDLISKIQKEVLDKNPFDYIISISLGSATTYNKKTTISEIQKIAEDNMYKQKIYAKPSNQRKTIDAVLQTLYEKDQLSEEHSQNVSKYAKGLAKKLNFESYQIELVETAALLHDVGKIIIPKEILLSTKKLTDYEYNEIKKHPEIGYRILNSVPELSDVANIILSHHERIDGKGYPNNLKGEDIPLISKIISICDAFDAMVNVRLYRTPLSRSKAIQELIDNKGTQFDSELVDVFIKNIDEITE